MTAGQRQGSLRTGPLCVLSGAAQATLAELTDDSSQGPLRSGSVGARGPEASARGVSASIGPASAVGAQDQRRGLPWQIPQAGEPKASLRVLGLSLATPAAGCREHLLGGTPHPADGRRSVHRAVAGWRRFCCRRGGTRGRRRPRGADGNRGWRSRGPGRGGHGDGSFRGPRLRACRAGRSPRESWLLLVPRVTSPSSTPSLRSLQGRHSGRRSPAPSPPHCGGDQ